MSGFCSFYNKKMFLNLKKATGHCGTFFLSVFAKQNFFYGSK